MPPVQARRTAAGYASLLPEGATALEIPAEADRPDFIDVHKPVWVPSAPTAVRVATPPPPPPPSDWRLMSRPECATVYITQTTEDEINEKRFAYAHIVPAPVPGLADPAPFIRAAIQAAAPELQGFELLRTSYETAVRFRSPADREAAMEKQPFAAPDGSGAYVRLARHASNCFPSPPMLYHAHVALRDYPVEQRTEEEIRGSFCSVGFVPEIDQACFAAPDLSPVHAVVHVEHPRDIPREIRIKYFDGSRNVVPVEILKVWYRSESFDANGRYKRLFGQPPAASA